MVALTHGSADTTKHGRESPHAIVDGQSEAASDHDDVMAMTESAVPLLAKAARAYEYKCKYYHELVNETVSELERGLKRAHVDELIVLLTEATEETQQMQATVSTVHASLGQLIPALYQAIQILEFQITADTQHLVSLDSERGEKREELTVDELVHGLGNVRLMQSIDRIEHNICRGGVVPPKVQVALGKAKRLGAALVTLLDQSRDTRALFQQSGREVHTGRIINSLAVASARTVEDTQRLASYNLKQSADEVREVEMQTSRQATALKMKSSLLERTKTSLNRAPGDEGEMETKGREEDTPAKQEEDTPKFPKKAPAAGKKGNTKGQGKGGGKKAKPAVKESDDSSDKKKEKEPQKAKQKNQKGKVKEKTKEPTIEEEKVPDMTREEAEAAGLESDRSEKLDEISRYLSEMRRTHEKWNKRLAEYHVRASQVAAEVSEAERVFASFPTKYRQHLEGFLQICVEDVRDDCALVMDAHKECTTRQGWFHDALEDVDPGATAALDQWELGAKPAVHVAMQNAESSLQAVDEQMQLLRQTQQYFLVAKSIWEVEVPTEIVADCRQWITALRDLNYRLQFNRKELEKVSSTLLREAENHEWRGLAEIELLAAPGHEVTQVVHAIEVMTQSNESLVQDALASIDRLARLPGLQKVDPLMEIQRAEPEARHRSMQLRALLNNAQRLIIECKHNVNSLLEDPAKAWNCIPLPRGPGTPIAVLKASGVFESKLSHVTCDMKHALEKHAVNKNQLLVSEIVTFPNQPAIQEDVILGISHGLVAVAEEGAVVKVKSSANGVDWEEVPCYHNHLFSSYDHPRLKDLLFAEVRVSKLALGYCVVVEYLDKRDVSRTGPQVYSDSKKVFRDGGQVFATQDKQSALVVPKDSFSYLSSVSVKSMTPGVLIEQTIREEFEGVSAISPLFSIGVESLPSSSLSLTLTLPYPQQPEDLRRPSTSRLTVMVFDSSVKQWILYTNEGRDKPVIELSGGRLSIALRPVQHEKALVVNGDHERLRELPERVETLVEMRPMKPYRDDNVLDETVLMQIVDRLTMEFDRFAVVLGISNALRNKSRVNKQPSSQQKYNILKQWRNSSLDSGTMVAQMLKSLRADIVARHDVADWLEALVNESRDHYIMRREQQNIHTLQPPTHREYLFSPVTVLSQPPREKTSRPNSRGLSDVSIDDIVTPRSRPETGRSRPSTAGSESKPPVLELKPGLQTDDSSREMTNDDPGRGVVGTWSDKEQQRSDPEVEVAPRNQSFDGKSTDGVKSNTRGEKSMGTEDQKRADDFEDMGNEENTTGRENPQSEEDINKGEPELTVGGTETEYADVEPSREKDANKEAEATQDGPMEEVIRTTPSPVPQLDIPEDENIVIDADDGQGDTERNKSVPDVKEDSPDEVDPNENANDVSGNKDSDKDNRAEEAEPEATKQLDQQNHAGDPHTETQLESIEEKPNHQPGPEIDLDERFKSSESKGLWYDK